MSTLEDLEKENLVLRSIIEKTVEQLERELKSPFIYGHRIETLLQKIKGGYVEAGIYDLAWLKIADRFDLGECPIQRRPVYIESREQMDGTRLWAVVMHEWVLSKNGKWLYEMLPSSRDEEFIELTRYEHRTLAYTAYQKFVEKGEVQTLYSTE